MFIWKNELPEMKKIVYSVTKDNNNSEVAMKTVFILMIPKHFILYGIEVTLNYEILGFQKINFLIWKHSKFNVKSYILCFSMYFIITNIILISIIF